MKRFSRMDISILIIVSFAVLSSWQTQVYGDEQENSATSAVMLPFSKAVLGIDKGVAGGDAEGVLSHAEAFQKVADAKLRNLSPAKNKDMIQLFDEYLATIGSLSSELVSVAKDKNFTEVSQVVEEIRRTCVSCHVRFRYGNDEKGFFPIRGNTIWGKVKILKLDGGARTDRSNVVVFLEGVESDGDFALPRKNPVLSQKNRRFTPKVLPVMKDTTVDFPNDDSIFHNVFSLSETQSFDLDIYPPGQSKSVTFPTTGWVKIHCSIHPQMLGHIIVLETPFFAVTDQKGIFVLSGVPDGEYTLKTWYEFGGEISKDIKVSGPSVYEYSLEIEEDKKLMPGLSYRDVGVDNPAFDLQNTPSCVGVLPEYFRTRPGTIRSVHPTHSVCGVGREAEHLLKDHHLDTTPCGTHSPFYHLREVGGQVLFLGCGMRPNTSMHAVEELVEPPYLLGVPVNYRIILGGGKAIKMRVRRHHFVGWKQRYDRLNTLLDADGWKQGKVLAATCDLVDCEQMWESGLQALRKDPFFFVEKIQ